jgi:MjaI restriction endonuclease
MIDNLKSAIQIIDRNLIQQWVEDLVLTKTYMGLRFQESVLKKIAAQKGQKYRLATPEEESSGIDGYIGDVPISIKPITYKTKNMLSEKIDVKIIYYEKDKDGLKITF